MKKILIVCYFSIVLGNAQSPPSGHGGFTVPDLTTIQADITITRTSGELPFLVYVSGMNTTATGTDFPYDELEYSWDFGDLTGSEYFTHPVTGKTVNANSDQTGPEAAYHYADPGTYTITLLVRGWTGSGFISDTANIQVSVSAWSGEDRYFDPVNGDDTNDGLSPDSPWQSWAELVDWLNGGDNRKALLKRGTTMYATNTLFIETSYIRIEDYDIGERPVIRANSPVRGESILRYWGSLSEKLDDHVYSNIVFDGNNGNSNFPVGAYAAEGQPSYIHGAALVNCKFTNDTSDGEILVQINGGGDIKDFIFWNCEFDHNSSGAQGLYAEMEQWLAIVGGTFSGGDGHIILDHHIYANKLNNGLYRWIDFQEAISKNFCINNNTVSDGTVTKYMLVDGCDITGTNNGLDWSNVNNDSYGQFDQVIVQNNAMHDLGTNQGLGILGNSVLRIVIRDNLFYGNTLSDIRVDDPDAFLQLYRNKFWKDSLAENSIYMIPEQDGAVFNNIFMHEGTAIQDWQHVASADFGNHPGWVADSNQYWSPNLVVSGVTLPFYDYTSFSRKTFAEWQTEGFDNNGSYSDPKWPDPANGNFGETPPSPSPVVGNIPNVTFLEDSSQTTLDLDDYVMDSDDDIADLKWSVSGNDSVIVVIESTTHEVLFSVPANWNGQEVLAFTATDPNGNSDSDYVKVVVVPVNDPPSIVELLHPTAKTVVSADSIHFVWTPAEDPDLYDTTVYNLYYSLDPDFVTFTAFTGLGDTTYDELAGLIANEVYYWRVGAVDIEELETFSSIDSFSTIVVGVELGTEQGIPTTYELSQNYPNPFNPVTSLRYDLPEQSKVVLTIYDILGRQVRTLVHGVEEPGKKSVVWDGTNDLGEQVSTGVYLYRIEARQKEGGQAGGFSQTWKMVLLR
ncbi:MAG: T9SS type A sorting domain-containing protein [Candidatus Marinimicrobia bacterium]|nr:T9SS type A sorting domain-containing protein [Candidatus Neomarinimicrobiota bacterium]